MIITAQYAADENGNAISITVAYDDGTQSNLPLNGITWLNQELNDWVKNGGSIAPPPSGIVSATADQL
jgi:hypothetical protein